MDKDNAKDKFQDSGGSISRRALIAGGGVAVLAAVAWKVVAQTKSAPAAMASPKQSATVDIEEFSPAGKSLGHMQVPRVVKSEAEWRKQLPADSFWVTRREDTERPGTGKYLNNHEAGIYRCICCDTALYDSQTKFESGTGWPSFWQPISRLNVVERTDNSLGMHRVSVSCSRCDAHLGHLFDDGPQPTGLRYCMNSVSLRFVART